MSLLSNWYNQVRVVVVRDSSAVWRLLWICCSRGTSEGYAYGKQRICLSNSWSAHFHVSWLSDFIFYQKPLYKSLHQSFFYSFITILPSESGVTLHYMVGMVGRTSQLACQREQSNRWVDMVGPMLARRMIFDGEMCSRLANVGIWPLTNRRPRVVGHVSSARRRYLVAH